MPENSEQIINLGGRSHASKIRKHVAQPLPYVFIAQIDLAQAASVSASALPDDGRLLFFCDLPLVPWRAGIESCRVIWDRSAPHALRKAEMPEMLQRFADDSIAELRAMYEERGLPAKELSHCYAGPERSMRVVLRYAIPDSHAPEAMQDAAFVAVMNDEDVQAAYDDFVSEHSHDLPERVAMHRVLGYPSPEQCDPRLTAVASVDYEWPRFWDWPQRPDEATLHARMTQWHLLLQCELSDCIPAWSEGKVYFLIRDEDLQARHFDRTVVVYQQT